MDFFRRKKRSREVEDGEIVEDEQPKTKRIVSWVKKKFTKLTSSITGSSSMTPNICRSGITLFSTPEHMKTERYSMTPHQVFSPTTSIARKTMYEYGSYVDKMCEDRQCEFKAGGGRYPKDVLPEHIQKYGSGYLNSDGGVLLVGIADDGRVQGIYCQPIDKANIVDAVAREFRKFKPKVKSPKYGVNFYNVSEPQTRWQKARGYRDFIPDCYVLEIAIRVGDPGEIYETGLQEVFIRREGSVQGPLNPLQIKDLVLMKYRQMLDERKKRLRQREETAEDDERPSKQRRLTPVGVIKIDLTTSP